MSILEGVVLSFLKNVSNRQLACLLACLLARNGVIRPLKAFKGSCNALKMFYKVLKRLLNALKGPQVPRAIFKTLDFFTGVVRFLNGLRRLFTG